MRKFLLLVFVFAMAMTAQAQDVLITKDGDALKVYGLELSATSVFYREGSGEDSPLVQKKKSDILMIKYSDGRREIFDEKGATSNGQQKEETASTEFTAEDKAANEAALKKWQSFPENKAKVKNKKAAYLCCVLRPNSDSRIADSNVELMFSGANMLLSWRNTINFVLSVRNKTNKTIYLDLGNTFFVKGEQSMAYYVPTANSSTSGTSTGVVPAVLTSAKVHRNTTRRLPILNVLLRYRPCRQNIWMPWRYALPTPRCQPQTLAAFLSKLMLAHPSISVLPLILQRGRFPLSSAVSSPIHSRKTYSRQGHCRLSWVSAG